MPTVDLKFQCLKACNLLIAFNHLIKIKSPQTPLR